MANDVNQTRRNSANWLDNDCQNQSVDRNRIHDELELKYQKQANADLLSENNELKKKVERLATENRMLHREVGKNEGMQVISTLNRKKLEFLGVFHCYANLYKYVTPQTFLYDSRAAP